ncbi:MAG: radical SAM protein [Elusimicrobia bacterium]|nr:radical SAM protein [Elusimicrobiota bacterium]
MLMNPFLKKNIGYALGKMPGLDRGLLSARLANIRWPVGLKARVCEVTVNSACNNKCLFCYSEPGSFGPGGPEPGLEEVFRALYLGRRQGCWLAAVIGGEPTLRGDIDKIASFARKAGYSCVKLCTNGAKLADPAYAARMAAAGFNMFDISLHGHNAALHDRLVGVPGAFALAVRAVKNIRRLGCEAGTNQVINALNYRRFPEFFDFAYNGLGMNYYNIIYGHYRGVMAANKELLKVRISRTLPYIKKGLAALENSGVPAFSRMLVNFTPCLLPGYLNLLADWESDTAGADPLMPADGVTVNMAEMKNRQSAKTKRCAGCALDPRCRGFDREYLALLGGAEFRPLARVPVSFRARTLFEDRPGNKK